MTTANTLQLEPDVARERCLNLVRAREQFCVEIDSRLIKDCVIVYRSGALEERPGWTHQRQRATSRDDACHFVVNLLNAELSFQVNPETVANRPEWLFLIELRSSGRTE